MFLALREIRHAKVRFGLITAVIVMVSSLVFILSGLANGLASGNSAAIDALPIDSMVVSGGSEYQLDRSNLPMDTVDIIRKQGGVDDASGFGASAANVRKQDSDTVIGVSMIAVEPDGFAAPEPESGDALGSSERGVVIDKSLVDEGVSIGDTLVTDPGQVELTVVGTVSGRSYRLVPTMYMSIALWQQVRPEGRGDAINAVLVQGEVEAPENTIIASTQQVIENLPGYSEQALTLLMIQLFLVVIAAGIVAAFFYIITLQKMPELGVMKAIGTKTTVIARALVAQVVMLGLVGIVLGTVIAFGVQFAIGGVVPFALEPRQFVVLGGVLLGVAVLGTLLSLQRIARVDPLDAINNAA